MISGKTIVIALVALVVGFGAGFALRPVVSPTEPAALAGGTLSAVSSPTAARGSQYFEAHLDEAQQVVAGCRGGTMRGDECANAEKAIVAAEARGKRRRFLGH